MLFHQEFYLLWASLELFMALTHLFVFLGFRNSKLGFLRRQHNYFLLDAFTHFINILLYSPSTVGIPLYIIWIYAVGVHLYYYRNLITNPPPKHKNDDKIEEEEDNSHKIARIFHWSCVGYQPNRFNIFQSGKEIFETTIDVIAHTFGFLLAFQNLQSIWYQIGALILMSIILYNRMIGLKYFLTDPKMMPEQLRRFFHDHSSTIITN